MTFNDIFKSSFLEKVSSFSLVDALIALAMAFAIGLFIHYVYRKTYTGVLYSNSFGVSLMAMTMITTVVILARYQQRGTVPGHGGAPCPSSGSGRPSRNPWISPTYFGPSRRASSWAPA